MSEIKTIECDDRIGIANRTYVGEKPIPDELRIGDVAELSCKGILVFVKITSIVGEDVSGIVNSFENYDEEQFEGVALDDPVTFKLKKVRQWI
jgi:hypothetical protein